MNQLITRKLKSSFSYIKSFTKWTIIAAITGTIGGLLGSLFSVCINYAHTFNQMHEWLIFLLPIGGLLIAGMYRLCKMQNDRGTNLILDSVRERTYVPWLMSPLIFLSTIITHLLGGSAGREGAALQLGGSLGSIAGKLFRLDEKDLRICVMCGMSAVFSALFCTPITAAFFALEVISVGITYYAALVPCIVSSVVAYFFASGFGLSHFHFNISDHIPKIDVLSFIQTIGLAAICAVLSIIFCVVMHKSHKWAVKLFKNEFLRAAVGGVAIILLTLIVQCRDYNGAGSEIIENAISGTAKPEAFILKMIFTAFTISFGFKGGEIVPTLFIGSTFGCVFAPLLGIDPVFGAALGLVCLFCGVINCPIAATFLSIEFFGAEGLILFATGSAVSYMLSGYYGLYSSQKIRYSKIKPERININAK